MKAWIAVLSAVLLFSGVARAKPTKVQGVIPSDCWVTKTDHLTATAVLFSGSLIVDILCDTKTKDCICSEVSLGGFFFNSVDKCRVVSVGEGRVFTIAGKDGESGYEVNLITGKITRYWRSLSESKEEIVNRNETGKCETHPDGYQRK